MTTSPNALEPNRDCIDSRVLACITSLTQYITGLSATVSNRIPFACIVTDAVDCDICAFKPVNKTVARTRIAVVTVYCAFVVCSAF